MVRRLPIRRRHRLGQARARKLDKYYPFKDYEVKGFLWWQGCKDKGNPAHAERYGIHLAILRALRKDFDAPNALFVGASIGETKEGKGGNEGKMMQGLIDLAQTKEEEFKGAAGFVYSHPLSTVPVLRTLWQQRCELHERRPSHG